MSLLHNNKFLNPKNLHLLRAVLLTHNCCILCIIGRSVSKEAGQIDVIYTHLEKALDEIPYVNKD